jgi:hypothetical protein
LAKLASVPKPLSFIQQIHSFLPFYGGNP